MNKNLESLYLRKAEELVDSLKRFNRKPDFSVEKYADGLKLPHPARIGLCKETSLAILGLSNPSTKEISDFLKLTDSEFDFYRWTHNVLLDYSFSPLVSQMKQHSDMSSSGSYMGNSLTFLLGMYNNLKKIPVFQISDTLCELLDRSDIDDDILVESISNIPYDIMYVEMGEKRPLDYWVHNNETGMHRLEGFYILKSASPPNPGIKESLTFVFCGEPKANILDDATMMLILDIGEEGVQRTLAQALARAVDEEHLTKLSGLSVNQVPFDDRAKALSFDLLRIAAKSILYLNHGHFDQVPSNEATDHKKRISNIANPAKREKAERLGYNKADRILIKPKDEGIRPNQPTNSSAGATASESFWRKGHFRNQRYGEKLSKTKIKWIAPYQVHPNGPGTTAKQKDYRLG